MTRGWYLRMNKRERVLAWTITGLLIVIVNLGVWSALLRGLRTARADLVARTTARSQQQVYLDEHATWQRRDHWLRQHQPVLKSAAEASTLLDQIKSVASKHNIVLENPNLGTSDSTPERQAVFASVETKSAWQPLVHFLYEMQNPEAFIVFENVSLAIESGDATQMRGKFKIARWFAPAGTGGGAK